MPSNMNQWSVMLRNLGFTDSAAKIYLLSLEMGPSPVQDIARKADVSRVTTYAVIEALMKDGLMSTLQKGKKTLYAAEAPERLVSYMHSRIRGLEQHLRDIESSIEQLKLLQRGEKPIVKLFEGPEALKAIQDDLLQSKPKKIYEFGNFDVIEKTVNIEDLKSFKTKIHAFKPLVTAVYATAKNIEPHSVSSRIRYIGEKPFTGDVFVYGNKVALSTFRGKQIAVLVESADLADMMRSLIEEAAHCNPKK